MALPTPDTVQAALYRAATFDTRAPMPVATLGPPDLFPGVAAASQVGAIIRLADPLAARVAELTRGALEGAPGALAAIAKYAPPPSTVLQGASGVLGLASLGVGLSGPAASALAGPLASIPYVGAASPALQAWGTLAPGVSAALGGAASVTGLAGGGQDLFSAWGRLVPPPAFPAP